MQVKTENLYEDTKDDVEKVFDISNYKIEGSLPIRLKKRSISYGKRWFGWKSNERVC